MIDIFIGDKGVAIFNVVTGNVDELFSCLNVSLHSVSLGIHIKDSSRTHIHPFHTLSYL